MVGSHIGNHKARDSVTEQSTQEAIYNVVLPYNSEIHDTDI